MLPEIGQLTNLKWLYLEDNNLPDDFPCRDYCIGSEIEAFMEYLQHQENAAGEAVDDGE